MNNVSLGKKFVQLPEKKQKKKASVRRDKQQMLIPIQDKEENFSILEQYRHIRTSIQFLSIDRSVKSIVITSSNPNEGKTTTAYSLAAIFAQQGEKVLLIDADLRKPRLHYIFNLNNQKGLSTVLIHKNHIEEAIQSTSFTNLNILPSGIIPINASELLGSNTMKELIVTLEQKYDRIIFDTPPSLVVTDGIILSNLVDASILVVKSKQTDKKDAKKLISLLEDATSKFLGVILQQKEIPKKKKRSYMYGK